MRTPTIHLFCISVWALCLALLFPYQAAAASAQGTALSPTESLYELKAGNQRFMQGSVRHPRQDARSRLDTARLGQAPIALVLACSDSREAVELLFDQGIGDLFVVRVAGNTPSAPVLGSIEYAVEHLHVPLIVVLGHTQCGAVSSVWHGGAFTGNLAALLAPIVPVVEAIKKNPPDEKNEENLKRLAEVHNVRNSLSAILSGNQDMERLVAQHKLRLVGAVYDLESGKVSWLDNEQDCVCGSGDASLPSNAQPPARQRQ